MRAFCILIIIIYKMMKKIHLLSLTSILSLFFACKTDFQTYEEAKNIHKLAGGEIKGQSDNLKKGIIKVKLSPEIGDKIAFSKRGTTIQSTATPLNAFLNEIQAKTMKRIFPYAGKFEERTRREGLHLWYEIQFDEDIDVSTAIDNVKKIQGVEIAEPSYKGKIFDYREISVYDSDVNTDAVALADNLPMNDLYLKRQWHYQNTGDKYWSKKGSDINLFKAWEIETGKPNVIVSIVDMGIDFNHPDLAKNMFINQTELNGQSNVDDDGNGYIDDVYGFNFAKNSGEIVPMLHATHVAGTIAALNNNGIGVCGIAGGNGTPNSGVRIMNSQIFSPGSPSGNFGAAIKYGADNGAVISQNSWGYGYPGREKIPEHVRVAIEYFTKYAGCDNDGNQLPDSPMKGGIVIFAAGNDGKEFNEFPASYPTTIAVAAMGADFKKTDYSEYGEWVDITAPGGIAIGIDDPRGVYSTAPNSSYAFLQGTSMACPHVSGVAALVVSKYGGQGFTNDNLRQRLLGALRPYNVDEKNPEYAGKMGVGYIDAYRALAENENKVPKTPKFTTVKESFVTLEPRWKAVADEDDETPKFYNIYYSENPLNNGNYKNADKIKVKGVGYNVGKNLHYVIKKLKLNTTYYLAIEAEDRWGLTSGVDFTSATTKNNHAPIIIRNDNEPIKINEKEQKELELLIDEPDEQEWIYEIKGHQKGVSVVKEGNLLKVTFKTKSPMGKHSLTLVVKDVFGASDEIKIAFEYYKNKPPVVNKEFNKIYLPLNNTKTINLNDYVTDPEGYLLTFTIDASSILDTSINKGQLTINSTGIGQATIDIVAKDSAGEKVEMSMQVQVVKGDDIVYIIYPVPVTKILNVQLSNEVSSAELQVRTNIGKIVLEKKMKISNDDARQVKLNLSKFSGGTYTLVVKSGGKTFEQQFVKY